MRSHCWSMRVLSAVSVTPKEADDICATLQMHRPDLPSGAWITAVTEELCELADGGVIVREDSGQGPATYRLP